MHFIGEAQRRKWTCLKKKDKGLSLSLSLSHTHTLSLSLTLDLWVPQYRSLFLSSLSMCLSFSLFLCPFTIYLNFFLSHFFSFSSKASFSLFLPQICLFLFNSTNLFPFPLFFPCLRSFSLYFSSYVIFLSNVFNDFFKQKQQLWC